MIGLSAAMARPPLPSTEATRGVYRGGDEIGQLGARFERMLQARGQAAP